MQSPRTVPTESFLFSRDQSGQKPFMVPVPDWTIVRLKAFLIIVFGRWRGATPMDATATEEKEESRASGTACQLNLVPALPGVQSRTGGNASAPDGMR